VGLSCDVFPAPFVKLSVVQRRWGGVRLIVFGLFLMVAAFLLSRHRDWGSAAASGPPPPEGQLLRNGGFEEPGSPLPEGWTQDTRQTGSKGTISTDTSAAHSGKVSIRLEPNGRNDKNNPLAASQLIPAGAYRGRKLRVSAFMRANGGATAVLAVISLVKGKPTNLVGDAESSGGAEWLQHAKEYNVPDDPSVQILVICSVDGHGGAAWFDDVSLIYGAERPLGTVAPPPISNQPFAAAVHVNAARVIRQIPRTLFGANVEWITNGNLLWNDKTGKADPTLAHLAADAGISLLRYPGGYYSDFYHWKNGTGPAGNRPEMLHTSAGKDKSRAFFGTDEALAFAGQIGAELLITVNAGSGTAQEAADWVRYVNRQALRVRYWEIGNELYINDGSPISKTITLDPETYARRFREFAIAMKAADPRIRIGAIGGENQGAYAIVQYPHWDETVLTKAGAQIDFFSVHNAYAPVNVKDHDNFGDVYRSLLAAPVLIARNLASIEHDIVQFAPSRASQIPIAVTEWGPFFQVDPKGAYAQHTKTLGSALFAASTLKTLIESKSTEIANFHLLNDLGFMGWIGTTDDSWPPHPAWAPTARYLAFQLFSRHFGSQLLTTEANSPTFNSPAIGLTGAVQNVPYLDVISSLSADGKVLSIIAINKNSDSPAEATFDLNAFEARPAAEVWTLNGTGLDANTGTKPLRIPGIAWGRQMEDPRNPRFSKGAPDEVTLSSSKFNGVKNHFQYQFPAHSVTALALSRR